MIILAPAMTEMKMLVKDHSPQIKHSQTKSIYYHDSQFLPLSTTIKFVFNFFFWRVFRSSFFGSSAHIESAVEEKEGMGSSHNLQVEVPEMRRTVSDKLYFTLNYCT